MVLIDRTPDTLNVPQGSAVPDSSRHDRLAPAPPALPGDDDYDGTHPDPDPTPPKPAATPTPATMPQRKPDQPAAQPAAQPTAAATASAVKSLSGANGSDDMAHAFATLAKAFGPQIDTDTIRRMVRDEFEATVFPTRTIVLNGDGNDITGDIPDTTHSQLADVLIDISASRTSPVPMSVLMVGPAGSGKSTIAKHAAKALDLSYGEISLNPMLPVTSLLGYMNATGEYIRTVFRDIWENGGVFHADEFDNSHPSTMATLNAALACQPNDAIAFPDGMISRHRDFVFIASANTFGRGPDRIYVGRQQLDAATLNRFVIEEITYDESLEHQMCLSTGYDATKVAEVLRYVRSIRKNITTKKMTVLMTPRNAAFACTLLQAGKSLSAVTASALRQGISDADWSKATDSTVKPNLR